MRRAYLQGSSNSSSDGNGYGGSGLKVVAEWNIALDSANASSAPASSATDDGLEAAVTRSTTTIDDHQDNNNNNNNNNNNGDRGAIDPTGLSVSEVLPQLQRAVAECLEAQAAEAQIDAGGTHRAAVVAVDSSSLSPDVSLVALGMDSMRGIQLQALLEAMFTVQLPDELMFEPDATLRTLAMALVLPHSIFIPSYGIFLVRYDKYALSLN